MNTGCAGKTVRSFENACHTGAPQRCVHDEALYKYTFTFYLCYVFQRSCDANCQTLDKQIKKCQKVHQKCDDLESFKKCLKSGKMFEFWQHSKLNLHIITSLIITKFKPSSTELTQCEPETYSKFLTS